MRFFSIVIAIIMLIPSSAFAQTLWQNVQFGMTKDQVKIAQPTALEPKEHSTLANGASCDLSIRNYTISSQNYTVCFYFKEGTLKQVMLSADFEPYDADFQDIVTLLKAKYGEPLSLNRNALGYDADWALQDGVNVSVTYFDQYTRLLNIAYQVQLLNESGKL